MSLKSEIYATPFKRQQKPITTPTWPGLDGKLFVRSLNAHEFETYTAMIRRSREDQTRCLAADVAVFVTVDAEGRLVFDDVDVDTKRLSEGDPLPLDVIFDAFSAMVNDRGDAEKKSGAAA